MTDRSSKTRPAVFSTRPAPVRHGGARVVASQRPAAAGCAPPAALMVNFLKPLRTTRPASCNQEIQPRRGAQNADPPFFPCDRAQCKSKTRRPARDENPAPVGPAPGRFGKPRRAPGLDGPLGPPPPIAEPNVVTPRRLAYDHRRGTEKKNRARAALLPRNMADPTCPVRTRCPLQPRPSFRPGAQGENPKGITGLGTERELGRARPSAVSPPNPNTLRAGARPGILPLAGPGRLRASMRPGGDAGEARRNACRPPGSSERGAVAPTPAPARRETDPPFSSSAASRRRRS